VVEKQPVLNVIDEYLSKNDLKRAEVAIAKALRSDPLHENKAEILIRRARVRLLSGRPEDALDDLQAVRESQAHNETPGYLELLADCFLARFELAPLGFADRSWVSQAQQYYQQILDGFPDYTNAGWVWYQLGRIAVILDQVDLAIHRFHRSFLAPTTVQALTAFCYERLGFIAFYEKRDLTTALGFLNRAVDTYPASEPRGWLAQVHLRRSRVLRQMQNYSAALDAAEKALSMAMGSGEARSGLAETLITLAEILSSIGNRDREVIGHLQHFLQISKRPLGVDVTWSRVYEMLGDAYLNSGEYVLAVDAYRLALQFNPDHPWEASLQYRLAKGLYQTGSYAEAEQILSHIVGEMFSDNLMLSDYRVYELLGSAQFAQSKYETAIATYEKALSCDPPAANSDRIRTYLECARERLTG